MGAAAVLAGFGFAAWGAGPAVGLMLAVLGAHEAGVIACSVAYIIEPWPIPAGVGQCSAWAGWNVSKAFGLLLLLALVKIHSTEHVNNDRC